MSQLTPRIDLSKGPIARLDRPVSAVNLPFTREEIEQSIPARFEKIVGRFSERVAIKATERSVTYAELNAMANRLARQIASQRSVVAEPIGILLEKGVEQTIAMLAVLKAGKFFVLLDTGFPKSRIAAILADSEAKLVISDSQYSGLLSAEWSGDRRLVLIESVSASDCVGDLHMGRSPAAIACITYTSGSTGQPKGVIQTDRNLLHEHWLRTRSSEVNERDRVALLTNGTANAISNIFLAFLAGATLCPFEVRTEGVDRLASWLVEERISICLISSSLFRALCRTLRGANNFPDLRFLRLRSEAAFIADVTEFEKYFSPKCVLVHGLSSSEAWAVCEYVIHPGAERSGNELPIGYAAQDKEISLIDEGGREVGDNTIGEIVVRSRYLSAGYWRQPELTASKFKVDPHDPEKRLYYTGDLALRLHDGCLIYKGRKDSRVKIRGYGVDLTEVENALREHPSVKEVAAVCIPSGSGEQCVAAYVTTAHRRKLIVSELRRFLKAKLPDYAIPSVFVALEKIPLTPSGKIDRMHLPPPKPTRPELTNFYLAPRNSAEEKLERIWAKVFGLDRVGIHDDFFDLGGHSLLAFRLISEVELEFGKAIPVATLLECPSVAQLAGALPTLSETGGSPLIAVQTSGSKPPFFCAHGADSYARLARYLGPDQPFYGLAQHLVGSRVHHTSIEGIAAHYLKAVRTVQPVGPYYIGGHSIGGLIAFEMAQQLRRLDQLVGLLVLLDSGSPPRSSAIMAANRVRHFRWEYAFNKFDIRHLKKVSWLARRWLDETLRLKAKALTCNVYHYLGLPLSPELKDFYVDQVVYGKIYPDAHRRYAPRTYSGRAVYFKSEDARERVAGWQKLMTRGLEVRPVTGSHLTMLVEPHVKGLAEALRECLTEAPQQAILQRASRNTASTSFDQIWTAS